MDQLFFFWHVLASAARLKSPGFTLGVITDLSQNPRRWRVAERERELSCFVTDPSFSEIKVWQLISFTWHISQAELGWLTDKRSVDHLFQCDRMGDDDRAKTASSGSIFKLDHVQVIITVVALFFIFTYSWSPLIGCLPNCPLSCFIVLRFQLTVSTHAFHSFLLSKYILNLVICAKCQTHLMELL